jgi:hypothetical protein
MKTRLALHPDDKERPAGQRVYESGGGMMPRLLQKTRLNGVLGKSGLL